MGKDKVVEKIGKIIEARDVEIAEDLGHDKANIGDVRLPEEVVREILDSLVLDEDKIRKVVANALPNQSLVATEPKYIKQHIARIVEAISKADTIKIKER